MEKITVVYWSQTGNTEKMAELIGRGISEAGKDAEVKNIADIKAADLSACGVFALGCPAMGAEVIEEDEMEPFVAEVEGFVSGKKVALFGSYGWGDGQWMRDWEERMTNAGATIVGGEGVICQDEPDGESADRCVELGKELANA